MKILKKISPTRPTGLRFFLGVDMVGFNGGLHQTYPIIM